MTIKEIEQIESGLMMLGYECDDLLNEDKGWFANFFNLYFFYSGYINYLRKINWSIEEAKQVVAKFPSLFQPGLLILTGVIAYISAFWFSYSISSLLGFVAFLVITFYFALKLIKQKTKRDLMHAVRLTSELRMHLGKLKLRKIDELLS